MFTSDYPQTKDGILRIHLTIIIKAMKTVLAPFDFFKTPINVLRFALDISSESKGAVYLFHVIELAAVAPIPVNSFEQFNSEDIWTLKLEATPA
jgi:hypothetical protein